MARDIDWESIENDYRAGLKTLRVIAAEHDITHGLIGQKAKKENWVRDLSAKIKARTEQLLTKQILSKELNKGKWIAESEIIESVAQTHVVISVKQRNSIAKHSALCEALYEEVSGQTISKEEFERLGELMYAPDEKGRDALYALYKKVTDTPSRVDSTKKLADTLKTLIGLERQAYGMADNANGDAPAQSNTPATDCMNTIIARLNEKMINVVG